MGGHGHGHAHHKPVEHITTSPLPPESREWWHLPRKRKPPGGVGAWVGCFAGAGYGLAVGVGAVKRRARSGGLDFVSPLPARVIVHDGALAGAYCGVGVGVGVGRMLAFGWGIPMPMLPHVHMPKIAGVPRMEDGSVNPAAAFAVFAGAVGNAARSVRNGVVGLPLRVFARIRAGV